MQDNAPIGLTVVVVIYNEAHYLPECLSRLSFADEIIVVDVGSVDDSARIAKDLGARVIYHEWVPFAEKAWPGAVACAKNDWIVFAAPDLIFPKAIGSRLRALIVMHEKDDLGAIDLPIMTCLRSRPLMHGQKGKVRSFRAAAHRERVHFEGLLHHRGDNLKDGYIALGLLRKENEAILHDWAGSISDAIGKAKRYLPYEAESRLAIGKDFYWRGLLRELWQSIKLDLRQFAFLEWGAFQIMIFQLWYIWKANMAVRRYCRGLEEKT